jgi:nicotinic acid phosphoribosyltransferase
MHLIRGVDPTLHPLMGLLHEHALQEAVTRIPKLEVDGRKTRWLAGHVARLAGQLLMCYRLNQVHKFSFDPYRYPPINRIQDTTLYL